LRTGHDEKLFNQNQFATNGLFMRRKDVILISMSRSNVIGKWIVDRQHYFGSEDS